MKTLGYLLFISIVVCACSKSNSRLEQSLQFAGANRVELEKVLQHYNSDPADSLKYRAACFLIENMPNHYFYQHETLEHYKREIIPMMQKMNCSSQDAIKKMEEIYGKLSLDHSIKTYDSHVITSEFLIKNIDLSFKVWQEKAWNKNLSFQNFCEDILPYRVGDEPLQNWKELYYNYFQAVLDTSLTNDNPLTAAKLLSLSVQKDWIYEADLPFPHLGADVLLQYKYGNCRDATDMGVYAMRSVGIPSGIDYFMKSPDRIYGSHLWNYVRDTTGKTIEFNFMWYTEQQLQRKKGKVYRKCYGIQENALPFLLKNQTIPNQFSNILMQDASANYFNGQIKLPVSEKIEDDVLYLGLFFNKSWIPITWSRIDKRQIHFKNVEPGICYMVLSFHSGKYESVSPPLIVSQDGCFHPVIADTVHLQQMELKRKYPFPNWWAYDSKGYLNSQIQGSDYADFRTTNTFYTVKEVTMDWYSVLLKTVPKVKYIRLVSGENGYNSFAEAVFIGSKDTIPLVGNVISLELPQTNNVKSPKEAVFDGDPLTYYKANEPSGAWVGLAFNEPKQIQEIRFLFRNDDNNMRKGDEYELFYCGENSQWISQGRKIAHEALLTYENVPSGGLYLLQNHTRGKEERIFTYENGKQVWW